MSRMKTLHSCEFCGAAFFPLSSSAHRFCGQRCAGQFASAARAAVRPPRHMAPAERAVAQEIADECMAAYAAAKEYHDEH